MVSIIYFCKNSSIFFKGKYLTKYQVVLEKYIRSRKSVEIYVPYVRRLD